MKNLQILLYDIDDIFLIVESKTNTFYTNQVGGVLCFQAEQEGALVPLGLDKNVSKALFDLPFVEGSAGITFETANLIDTIFESHSQTAYLKVDRSRLKKSLEAWIYVKILNIPYEFNPNNMTNYFGSIYGKNLRNGVVTWPNSD